MYVISKNKSAPWTSTVRSTKPLTGCQSTTYVSITVNYVIFQNYKLNRWLIHNTTQTSVTYLQAQEYHIILSNHQSCHYSGFIGIKTMKRKTSFTSQYFELLNTEVNIREAAAVTSCLAHQPSGYETDNLYNCCLIFYSVIQ